MDKSAAERGKKRQHGKGDRGECQRGESGYTHLVREAAVPVGRLSLFRSLAPVAHRERLTSAPFTGPAVRGPARCSRGAIVSSGRHHSPRCSRPFATLRKFVMISIPGDANFCQMPLSSVQYLGCQPTLCTIGMRLGAASVFECDCQWSSLSAHLLS